MRDCLFCGIAAGEIPSEKVYEDDRVLAFRDVTPQAPVHVLFIPKAHISGLNALSEKEEPLMGYILRLIRDTAEVLGLKDGYRVVSNCGSQGGQTVDHLHFHLLGGREMRWPPG
jgi:histidine triad (HIT) family protein